VAEATTSAKSGYQEIFAAFFAEASEAEAHYYSIKSFHSNIRNLATLTGVSQENFQILLVASGFGSLWKNGKEFIFSKNKFESFMSSRKLNNVCELVQCQPKGVKIQLWFVKVWGSKYQCCRTWNSGN
jgi:hypothetical protein